MSIPVPSGDGPSRDTKNPGTDLWNIGGVLRKGVHDGVDDSPNTTIFWPPPGGARRIVFVVDSSGSMNTNFDYLKVNLAETIKGLYPRVQFNVILFAEGPIREFSINGKTGLQYASPKNKEAAKAWIDKQYAQGETQPTEALRRAFAVNPQLIYFLTDGLIPKETLEVLATLNKDKKVAINTIAFITKDGEPMLQKIAKEHNGRYRFVSESDLSNKDE